MSNKKMVARVPTSSVFSMKIHHGGMFTKFPGRRYVDGYENPEFEVDYDEFSVHELDGLVKKAGYDDGNPIYYHFLVPETDLDVGLRALGNDADVHLLGKYIGLGYPISVFLEHGVTRLDTYFNSPLASKVIIEDIEVVKQNAIEYGKKSSGRRLMLEWNEIEADENDTRVEVNETMVEVNPTETRFEVDETEVEVNLAETRFGVNETEFNAPGVNETEVEQNETEVEQNETEVEQNETEVNAPSVNVPDEHIKVDENNVVEEIDVDMTDFHLNVDQEFECMGSKNKEPFATNVGDVEITILDNDTFGSTSESDDDLERIRQRKLRDLKKQNECENNLYKYFFYPGQDFGTTTEVKKRIGLHSIETRRELKLTKNDKLRVRAICAGKVLASGPSQAHGPSQASDPSHLKISYGSVPQQRQFHIFNLQ